jgi:hypothetical protein
MNVAIRGFTKGRTIKRFEESIEISEDDLETLLPALAEKHAREMAADELHMIEIEFLDEPNPNERFFRFGTDPAGMVAPLAVPDGDIERVLRENDLLR